MTSASALQDGPKTLIAQGYEARRAGNSQEAKAVFTRAVNLSRAVVESDPKASPQLAEALTSLGQVERDLGEISAALQHYQEAAELYRSLPSDAAQPLAVAHTVRHVADIMRVNGDLVPAAAGFYDEALLIYRDHPETSPLDLANTLRGYALLKASSGHSQAAIAFFEEARILYIEAAEKTGLDLQPAFEEVDRQIAQLSQLQ